MKAFLLELFYGDIAPLDRYAATLKEYTEQWDNTLKSEKINGNCYITSTYKKTYGGKTMMHLEIFPQKLYEGCLLAALVHAVTVGEYPEFNYEHSWDGINYCMNNSEGCRGIITFHKKYIIAAFREESKVLSSKDAINYLKGAPTEIIELANAETLQYLLDDVSGVTKPVITAAFWGSWEELFSNQPIKLLLENCANIIENQLLELSEAMEAWNDNYEFHNEQEALIRGLFSKKMSVGLNDTITLNNDEADALYGEIDECTESLRELNILI